MQYALGQLVWNFEQHVPSHLLFLVNMWYHQHDYAPNLGWKGFHQIAKDMADMALQCRATLVSFIIPAATHIDLLKHPADGDQQQRVLKKVYQQLAFILQQAPSLYIDVLSSFQELSTAEVMVRSNNDHLNRHGHKVVATILAQHLIHQRERGKIGQKNHRDRSPPHRNNL